MAWSNYERVWSDRDKTLDYQFYSITTHDGSDCWDDLLVMNNGKSVLDDPKYAIHETITEDGLKYDNSPLQQMRSDIIRYYDDYVMCTIQEKDDWTKYKWFVYNKDERPRRCIRYDDEDPDFYLLYGELGNAEIAKIMDFVKHDYEWWSCFERNYTQYSKVDLFGLMYSYILKHTPKTQYKSLVNLIRFDDVMKKFTEIVLKPVKYTYKLMPSNSSFEKQMNICRDNESKLLEQRHKLELQIEAINDEMGILWRS